MQIPKRFTSGDSLTWNDRPWMDSANRSLCTSSIWTLTYQIRGPAQLTAVAVASGDGWTTSVSSEQCAALIPGTYTWAAYISQNGQRMCIGGGTLFVQQDLGQVNAPISALSVAEQALADCEKALATFSSGGGGKIQKYTIGGRDTQFASLADLMAVRNFWQSRVNRERTRDAVRNGRGNPRQGKVRFVA